MRTLKSQSVPRLIIAALMFLTAGVPSALAVDSVSGDPGLDTALHNIDARFQHAPDKLVTALSREYMVAKPDIINLREMHGFSPAYCFLVIAIADLSGQPVDMVARAWLEHQAQGWPYVLEQLGLPPGSSEFDQLLEDALLFE